MNEKNEHIGFEQLAGKYLSGEASEQEVFELEKLVKENPDLKKEFLALREIWRQTLAQKAGFASEAGWQNIADKIRETETIELKPQKAGSNFALKIAASIVVLVALGFTLFYLLGNHQVELMAEGAVLEQTLPDGSKVTLNQYATLSFAKAFKGEERRVKLTGDAYFEVARNENKPFIIETGEVSIRVLGTSFYVKAKPEAKSVEVVVNSGKVAMFDPNQKSIELTKGEVGVFEKDKNLLTESINNNQNYLSWKTRKMVFENTPLDEVARVIESTYIVEVTIGNSSLKSCRLTAAFEDYSLEDVAIIIEETLGIQSELKEGKLIFSGNGCN